MQAMKAKTYRWSLVTAFLTVLSVGAWAQQNPAPGQAQPQRPERPRGGPEGGPAGIARANPLFTALDANGDGTIDDKEIAGAVAALKKLDKNGDGKLTEDEVRPAFGRGGRGGGGGGGAGREGGPAARNPEDTVNRLMQFDKNADGKLGKDELPERMQAVFARGDKDGDGFLSKDEVKAIAEAPRPAAEGRRPEAPQNPTR